MARKAVSQAVAVLAILVIVFAGVAVYGFARPTSSTVSTVTQTTTATTTVTGQTTTTGLTTVKVGSLPITDEAPFFTAIDYGIFAKYGINPVIVTTPGSGGSVEGLVTGSVDVALISPPAVISFAAQTGNYLHFLAAGKLQGSAGGLSGDGPSFMVRTGVTVNTPADLAGKTILTNAIGGPNYFVPLYLMENAGVKNSTITWKSISFPSMPEALITGQADAASMAQPFAGAMVDNGTAYSIDHLFGAGGSFVNALGNPAMVSAWWTTPQKYQQNPDLFNRFVEALNEGLAYSYAMPNFALNATNHYTKVPVSVLQGLEFTQEFFQPYNSNSPQVHSMITAWANLMSYTGYLKPNFDTSGFYK